MRIIIRAFAIYPTAGLALAASLSWSSAACDGSSSTPPETDATAPAEAGADAAARSDADAGFADSVQPATESSTDAPTTLDVSVEASATCPAASTARAPEYRRATPVACPMDRGPGTFSLNLPTDAGSPFAPQPCAQDADASLAEGQCVTDSDCTAGLNGRCVVGFYSCHGWCSYDDCISDSDCPGHVPCECRTSGSDSTANACLTSSNCSVDSDCGPGGYCSPSMLDSTCDRQCVMVCSAETQCFAGGTPVPCYCSSTCPRAYFCHTACDTCVDDSDCDAGPGSCAQGYIGGWNCLPCAVHF